MITMEALQISLPVAQLESREGDTQTGYSVSAKGTGSFSGLSYTVPAHTSGKLKAKIQIMAMTSDDVKKLNDMAFAMLSVSKQKEVREYERTHASANLSLFGMFFGGNSASASYDKTKESMETMGLTKDQISMLISGFYEIAKKMSHVVLDFNIDNTANDYSVSGDLQLYTISGNISTEKGTTEYRMLANKGTAGSNGDTAPAAGEVIPLS